MRDVPAGKAAVPPISIPAASTVLVIVAGVVDDRRVQLVHRSVIDALRRHRPACVQLDLSDCTAIEATAVHALRLCRADAAQLDCELIVARAPAPVQPTLRAAGLIDDHPGERRSGR